MGIIVEWRPEAESGTEYIDDIDLDNLEDGYGECVQMQTEFWSPKIREFTKFEAEVWIERSTNGRIDIVVRYDRGLNPKIQDDSYDSCWGTNRIIVEQGENHGNYHWKGDNEFDFESIKSKGKDKCGWRKYELREPKEHRGYRRRNRKKTFRDQIIAKDRKCVISREKTELVLEAAHIIPDKDDGSDTPKNGIALRVDIHRLYDKKMSFINPKSGEPVINNKFVGKFKLSSTYKNLLKDSKGLPSETLKRVSKALQEVWPGG